MPDDKKLTTIFVVRFWYPSKRKKLLYYPRVFGHISSIEKRQKLKPRMCYHDFTAATTHKRFCVQTKPIKKTISPKSPLSLMS